MDLIVEYLLEKLGYPEVVGSLFTFDYQRNGALDSLGYVRFVLEIEGHYKIRFTDAEIDSNEFHTVGGLAKIIEGKLK